MLSGPWVVETLTSVDSTNRWLLERVDQGASEGLAVRARHQSAGRGRRGRTWESPMDDGLWCSLLLRPPVSDDQLQLVVASVALAFSEAIATLTGVAPAIKWPNDLLIGDRKVGGILAELRTSPAGRSVVVGVGINCLSSPPDLPTATSLQQATGVVVRPEALFEAALSALTELRPLLDTERGWAMLRERYQAALDTIGRTVRIETGDGTLEGVATSVDETGALLVNVGGTSRRFVVGDVVHLRAQEQP